MGQFLHSQNTTHPTKDCLFRANQAHVFQLRHHIPLWASEITMGAESQHVLVIGGTPFVGCLLTWRLIASENPPCAREKPVRQCGAP